MACKALAARQQCQHAQQHPTGKTGRAESRWAMWTLLTFGGATWTQLALPSIWASQNLFSTDTCPLSSLGLHDKTKRSRTGLVGRQPALQTGQGLGLQEEPGQSDPPFRLPAHLPRAFCWT